MGMDATDKQIERCCPADLKAALDHQTLRIIYKTVNAMNSAKQAGGEKAVDRYVRNLTPIQQKALSELVRVSPQIATDPRAMAALTQYGLG